MLANTVTQHYICLVYHTAKHRLCLPSARIRTRTAAKDAFRMASCGNRRALHADGQEAYCDAVHMVSQL